MSSVGTGGGASAASSAVRGLPAPRVLGALLLRAKARPFDVYLAETLGARAGEVDARVLACVALASHALRQGDVCIDLAELAGEVIEGGNGLDTDPPSGSAADLDPVELEPAAASRLGLSDRRPDSGGSARSTGADGAAGNEVEASLHGAVFCAPREAAREDGTLRFPDAQALRRLLLASPLVGVDGEAPCVLNHTRLYVQRYWRYEQAVAAALGERARAPERWVDRDRLRQALRRWFPTAEGAQTGSAPEPDRQALAAALVCTRSLLVITGGPGTGKTTTLARIVGVLAELHAGQSLRMALVAPTGKGANRARAALASALAEEPLSDAARALVPKRSATIHRLIGAGRGERAAHYHAGHPLPVDVLLVDEASMVDLRLMHMLLDALPARAQLVLLGDPDQLASVEPGAVLADLDRVSSGPDARTREWLETLDGPSLVGDEGEDAPSTGLANTRVRLTRPYRFGAGGAVGALADAIKAGCAEEALELLHSNDQLSLRDLAVDDENEVGETVAERYRKLWREGHGGPSAPNVPAATADPGRGSQPGSDVDGDAERGADRGASGGSDRGLDPLETAARAIAAYAKFTLLSPYRTGPWGTEQLNARVLAALGLEWVRGRWPVAPALRGDPSGLPCPIMVVRNDYRAQLFNGDMGVMLGEPAEPLGSRRAYFPHIEQMESDSTRAVRTVSVARLPTWELAFATTVHKAQGSEFEHVALVLPERRDRLEEPLVTRELLYTAVTRARSGVEIWAKPEVLDRAIRASAPRASGLGERMREGARLAERPRQGDLFSAALG